VRIDEDRYVEVQGTAETTPFNKDSLNAMLSLADAGIDRLQEVQREILGDALKRVLVPQR
jgi:ribonuclease PH